MTEEYEFELFPELRPNKKQLKCNQCEMFKYSVNYKHPKYGKSKKICSTCFVKNKTERLIKEGVNCFDCKSTHTGRFFP